MVSENLRNAKAELENSDLTCVIVNGSECYTSDRHGIAPIIYCLRENPQIMRGAAVADKVIGKAAAMLFAYGGISEIHAGVLSSHAADFLESAGIKYSAGTMVDYIVNRDKTGMCPMEERALDLFDAKAAFELFNGLIK